MVKKTSVNISQHSKALHILVMTTDTEAGTDRGHVIRMAKPPGALCLHSGSASGRLGICWHALPNVSSFPNQAVIFFFSGNSSLIQLLKSITPESDIYSPHAILCCVLHFLSPQCFHSGPSQHHLLLRSLHLPPNWSPDNPVLPVPIHSPHSWLHIHLLHLAQTSSLLI